MLKPNKSEKPRKEVFQLPEEAARVLTELQARTRLDTGARITKVSIISELLLLLKSAKISTKKVHGVGDIMEQFKEYIRQIK